MSLGNFLNTRKVGVSKLSILMACSLAAFTPAISSAGDVESTKNIVRKVKVEMTSTTPRAKTKTVVAKKVRKGKLYERRDVFGNKIYVDVHGNVIGPYADGTQVTVKYLEPADAPGVTKYVYYYEPGFKPLTSDELVYLKNQGLVYMQKDDVVYLTEAETGAKVSEVVVKYDDEPNVGYVPLKATTTTVNVKPAPQIKSGTIATVKVEPTNTVKVVEPVTTVRVEPVTTVKLDPVVAVKAQPSVTAVVDLTPTKQGGIDYLNGYVDGFNSASDYIKGKNEYACVISDDNGVKYTGYSRNSPDAEKNAMALCMKNFSQKQCFNFNRYCVK